MLIWKYNGVFDIIYLMYQGKLLIGVKNVIWIFKTITIFLAYLFLG